jgi:hypothetical protein
VFAHLGAKLIRYLFEPVIKVGKIGRVHACSLPPNGSASNAENNPFSMETTSLAHTASRSLIPSSAARLDPAWNRARELLREGLRVGDEFTREIERLRGLYLLDKNANLIPKGSSKSHDETSNREDGFKAAIARELGIGTATAYRYLARAKALGICDQVEQAPDGETIDLDDGTCYPVTEKTRKKARELREAIETGGIAMNRVMPAVSGMFLVAGGGKGGKAATNHPQNIWAGVQKLRTSLLVKHWRQGEMPGKATWEKTVNEWATLLRQMPDELRACTAAWVDKGMPHQD